jgi:hypothetical protein
MRNGLILMKLLGVSDASVFVREFSKSIGWRLLGLLSDE